MARPMMLLAYDASGRVVATLDFLVSLDENGDPRGLVDFAEVEAAGELTDVWRVDGAVGSGTWPEWLGSRASEFRVERAGGRIVALEHVGRNAPPGEGGAPVPASGHRRRRQDVEDAIAERIAAAHGDPADIRDLVGGPDRPLGMDPEGRSTGRGQLVEPTALPVIGRDTRTGPTPPAGLPGADSPPPESSPQ